MKFTNRQLPPLPTAVTPRSSDMNTLPVLYQDPAAHYSEASLFRKLKKYARAAGEELVEKSLVLYYTLQKSDTPLWAKTVIYSVLGYFILPLDLIPDALPPLGFTDDLGAILAALATISLHVTPDVKEKARARMSEWFVMEDDEAE